MTSPSPLLYDTCYHIFNRGNNRENIFVHERNYTHFMNLYSKYIEPIADTYAYCLLRNHFHLSVRIKSQEEIIEILQKTLKASSASKIRANQNSLADRDPSQPRKPLGSYFNRFFLLHFLLQSLHQGAVTLAADGVEPGAQDG